jgi:hypothetical protein
MSKAYCSSLFCRLCDTENVNWCLASLATLPVFKLYGVGWINNEVERIWKKSVVIRSKYFPAYFLEITEENQEKTQREYQACKLRFKPNTWRIGVQIVTAKSTCPVWNVMHISMHNNVRLRGRIAICYGRLGALQTLDEGDVNSIWRCK